MNWRQIRDNSFGMFAVRAGFTILIGILGFVVAYELLPARHSTDSVADQLRELEKIQEGLSGLSRFVRSQSTSIENEHNLLEALKQQESTLKPIVEADQHTVDALFRLQDARNKASLLREQAIAFGLGVLSSLMASLIWFYLTSNSRPARRAAPAAPSIAAIEAQQE